MEVAEYVYINVLNRTFITFLSCVLKILPRGHSQNKQLELLKHLCTLLDYIGWVANLKKSKVDRMKANIFRFWKEALVNISKYCPFIANSLVKVSLDQLSHRRHSRIGQSKPF